MEGRLLSRRADAPVWKVLRRFALALRNVALIGAVVKAFWFGWALATEDGTALSRLEYIRSAAVGQGPRGTQSVVAGEWAVGTLSMAAAAAAQLNAADRLRDTELFADQILTEATAQFDTQLWHESALASLDGPNGHIGYLGHAALALAAACTLGSSQHEDDLTRITEALARRLDAAEDGLLETYPGQRWIPDNVVVGAALAQTDRCRHQTRFQPTLAHWLERLRAHALDPQTGLLRFTPTERPRGSGATWDVFYLAMVDEAFAREQWALARKHFEAAPLPGLAGFREFLPGVDGRADVDSGPVIFGISTSAGGFGFAGAALEGDLALLTGLRRTAELFGFSAGARRHYLAAPLVGEAIVLAMGTARPWQPGPVQRWSTAVAGR